MQGLYQLGKLNYIKWYVTEYHRAAHLKQTADKNVDFDHRCDRNVQDGLSIHGSRLTGSMSE